mgnify:CR=1 FL=1
MAPAGIALGVLQIPPTVSPYDEDGNFTISSPFEVAYKNPLATLKETTNKSNAYRILGSAFGEYELLKDLKLKVLVGTDVNLKKDSYYSPSTLYESSSQGGIASIGHVEQASWVNENTLSYNKVINKNHNIGILAGFTQQEKTMEITRTGSSGYNSDALKNNSLQSGTNVTTPYSDKATNTMISYLGRINYNYAQKYDFTFSIRTDGSSRFGKNNKWGTFPSIGYSYNVSNEKFFRPLKRVLNDAKIRLSYGVTGNQEIDNYQSLATLSSNRYFFGNQRNIGYYPNRIANDELGWETTRQFDAGLDLGFFKNRLNIVVDYYYKKTSDLLLNVAIDKISAASNFSEQLRHQYVNEAKFLRALHYFNLVRWFRNVPLVLHETTSLSTSKMNVKQAFAAEVYGQIIQDLTDAENLPVSYPTEDAGRVTSGSAKALLAKVYLTRREWQKAADKAKEVIDSGQYGLFENFDDAFDSSTKNGKEHIFSIQFNGYPASYNNLNANAPTPLSYEVPGSAGLYADAYKAASNLYASFGDKDKRRDVSFATEVKVPTTGKVYKLAAPHINKFYDPDKFGNQGSSERNFTYMRYSDVLLIYAEAENELHGPTAEAYAKIDEVRLRAGIDLLKDVAPNLTKDEFREYVFEERRKEFVYEANRWFDLTRRGADYFVAKLHAAGKTNAKAKNVILPIPQRELDINPNLVQNDEWK